MNEVTMSICKRDNWCVDCDNKECFLAGDIEADCPKYRCDSDGDCENCKFIRDLYKQVHGDHRLLRRKTMDDLIRRQDAIEAIASRDETDGTVKVFTGREVNEILSALPSDDRPTGKWIPVTNGRAGHECDQCHDYAPSWKTGEEHLTEFCPNCGAKMEENHE